MRDSTWDFAETINSCLPFMAMTSTPGRHIQKPVNGIIGPACTISHKTTRIIYRDGEEVARDTPTAVYAGSGKLMVGAQYDDKHRPKFKFEGEIAELRIWDKAKSKDKIITAMNASLKGDEAGLVGYWRYSA